MKDKIVNTGPDSLPLVYTIEQAAKALNVSTKTIRRWLDPERKLLTAIPGIRRKLIPREQLTSIVGLAARPIR